MLICLCDELVCFGYGVVLYVNVVLQGVVYGMQVVLIELCDMGWFDENFMFVVLFVEWQWFVDKVCFDVFDVCYVVGQL